MANIDSVKPTPPTARKAIVIALRSMNQPMSRLDNIKNPWPYCSKLATCPRNSSGTNSYTRVPAVVRNVDCAKPISPMINIAAGSQWD